jgi:hypothetical protein
VCASGSVRIWMRPRVKVGGRYRMDRGFIEMTAIRPITRKDVTPELARGSGFKGDRGLAEGRAARARAEYLSRRFPLPRGCGRLTALQYYRDFIFGYSSDDGNMLGFVTCCHHCNFRNILLSSGGSTGFVKQPMNPAARVSSTSPNTSRSAIASRGMRRIQPCRCERSLCASW